jgi:biopolymer transport protein ExbD
MVLSIAAILAAFGIFISGFYGYRAYRDHQAQKKRIVYLHKDGTFAFDSPRNIVTLSELEKIIASYTESAGKEDNSIFSNFKMYVQADPESRMWQWNEALKLCYMYYVRPYLRESNSDDFIEIPLRNEVDVPLDFAEFVNSDKNKTPPAKIRGHFFGIEYNPTSSGISRYYGHYLATKTIYLDRKTNSNIDNFTTIGIETVARLENEPNIINEIKHDFSDNAGNFAFTEFISFLKRTVNESIATEKEIAKENIPIFIEANDEVEMKNVFRILRIIQALELRNYTFETPESAWIWYINGAKDL